MCRVSTRLSLFLSLVRSDVRGGTTSYGTLFMQGPGLHLIVSVGEAVALEKVVVENTTKRKTPLISTFLPPCVPCVRQSRIRLLQLCGIPPVLIRTCGPGFFRNWRPRGRPRRRSRLALGVSGAARRGWPGRRQCGALGWPGNRERTANDLRDGGKRLHLTV